MWSAARKTSLGIALGASVLIAIVMIVRQKDDSPCGPGFHRDGWRCRGCAPPLEMATHGCGTKEHDVVDVPAVTVVLGASDWEAEGRVAARTLRTSPFRMDRFEVTSGRACASAIFRGAPFCDASDPARAAFAVTLDAARTFCREAGGRLPTDDEWLAAAAGDKPRRYPWGDTGAVCRRAAWGLSVGPCAEGATGPDTVGAHPDGASPLGIHDLAGNVSEWVEGPTPSVRGGSYASRLATELRTWLRREVPGGTTDSTIGFRCAYDGVR